jgi:hypothetical protein
MKVLTARYLGQMCDGRMRLSSATRGRVTVNKTLVCPLVVVDREAVGYFTAGLGARFD